MIQQKFSLLQTVLKILISFFAEIFESIHKIKIGHALQHYVFQRELNALRFQCMILNLELNLYNYYDIMKIELKFM